LYIQTYPNASSYQIKKESWFKCVKCGKESYCGIYFEKIPDAEVMCPYCLNRMKLKETRIREE